MLWMKLIFVISLHKACTYSCLWCLNVQVKVFIKIRLVKTRAVFKSCFNLSKTSFQSGSIQTQHPVLWVLCCNHCIFRDKFSEKSSSTKESSYSFLILWGWHLFNGFHFLSIWQEALSGVTRQPRNLKLLLANRHFPSFNLKPVLSESRRVHQDP